MQKKFLLFLVIIISFSETGFSQAQAYNWYFGILAGVNFSTGAPVALTNGALVTNEGCASISDASGNLLFYTDGVTAWNTNHVPMVNGTGLLGDPSSTQSGIIVPKPGSTSLYYLFTIDDGGGPDGFRFSVVDMSAQSGLGEVTSVKNVFVMGNVTEKLSAVHAANGIDYWIMVHEWNSDAFYAFKLDANGLSATPVVSNVGTIHNNSVMQNTYGYLKFSPGGNKIALAIGYQDMFELLDFDDQTGIVSNAIQLPVNEHVYGVEFSPDNARLYTTHYSNTTFIYTLDQYDLTAGTASAIINSRIPIASVFDPDEMRALQLATDGKIYVAKKNIGFLAVINYPDSLGAACNFVDNAVSLGGNACFLGLPNFITSYFKEKSKPISSFIISDSTICAGDCISFTDNSQNAPVTWQWTFQGGNPATSNVANPTNICYAAAGTYDVTLITGNSIGLDTLYLSGYVNVNPPPPPPTINMFDSTLISSIGVTYQWYFNSAPIAGATNQVYVATQAGEYYVVITDGNGCSSASDIVTYTSIEMDEPDEDGIQIYPNPFSDFITVVWNESWTNNISITIINALGKTIVDVPSTEINPGNSHQINLQSLPEGMYFLMMKREGNIVVKKIAK